MLSTLHTPGGLSPHDETPLTSQMDRLTGSILTGDPPKSRPETPIRSPWSTEPGPSHQTQRDQAQILQEQYESPLNTDSDPLYGGVGLNPYVQYAAQPAPAGSDLPQFGLSSLNYGVEYAPFDIYTSQPPVNYDALGTAPASSTYQHPQSAPVLQQQTSSWPDDPFMYFSEGSTNPELGAATGYPLPAQQQHFSYPYPSESSYHPHTQ